MSRSIAVVIIPRVLVYFRLKVFHNAGKNNLQLIQENFFRFFRLVHLILWDELKARAENYPIGEVPAPAYTITGGADVHKNRIELIPNSA